MIDTKELVRQASELADSGKPDEAMDIINRVLLDEPDNPAALFVGCVVMQHAARHTQGIQFAKRITEVAPKDPRGWRMLSYAYGELNRYDECIRYAEKSAECRRDAQSLEVLAYAYVNGGEWDKAEQCAVESLKLAKSDPDRWKDVLRDSARHLSYCHLARKHWTPGFTGFRTTMRTKWRKEWQYNDSVEWQGESDAVVMVTGEQGIGDEVMAASVVPTAAKSCKRFILDCDRRLADLFQRSFPDVVVTPTRRTDTVVLPPGCPLPTHHKSLFGLGELFRKSDADFDRKPYLVANPEYVRMFRALLGEGVVGLAWSGGFLRTGLVQRTAGLNAFLPLIRRGGKFLSLQYKDDAEEVAQFRKQYGLEVMTLPWVTQGKDMDLLAGLLAALGGVVGVHTSALHLSSALGVPTTILTHRGSGWRYAPDELLWYPPTTVMHRKRKGESWRECVGRL